MNKTLLIIQREFLSRVKKKSFLIVTLLVPLIFPAITGGVIYLMKKENDNAEVKTIHVLDENGNTSLANTDKFNYVKVEGNLEQAKKTLQESDDYALLYIPQYDIDSPKGFTLYAKSNPNLSTVGAVEKSLEEVIKTNKLESYNIDKSLIDKLKTNIDLRSINISEGEEKENSAGISYIIGYATGFLIYIFMFVYGGQVMQGVMEEKTSKIVEVIVSTVKPFNLMLGKIFGVASVGLFQILIWVVLMTIVTTVAGSFLDFGVQEQAANPELTGKAMNLFNDIPFAKIIACFIFYFVGGFLLYGALFAAVGSAVDSPAEAQQFMMPVMLPLIIGIIGVNSAIQNPEGSLSFWLSIIPFTSPITMMARIGFDVPWWQLALSMSLLVIGFIFTTWLAGKIYRIGILTHGSKVNYKTLAAWLMMKD